MQMSTKNKAVGIHVFAGGFTAGVQQASGWEVDTHLESLGFGLDTASKMCGVTCINEPQGPKAWPRIEARMAFANPKCTGFSTITSGYGEDTHGPWAKQTCGIHEVCEYAVAQDFEVAVWESVQQAYTTGRPLIDYLVKEHFAPKNYRVAHLFINAATFGNPQQRKRYFFVAYKDCYKFNVEPPVLDPYYPVLYDALWDIKDLPTEEGDLHTKDAEYHPDCYVWLTPDEKHCVRNLPNGWDVNTLGRYARDLLPETYKFKWDYRTSDLPFSLHSVVRTNWLRPSPTLHSSCQRFIHPLHHRPLTVREICAIMGWPGFPVGPNPAAQVAKGIVPAIGKWLADQATLCLDRAWGDEDFESSFDAKTGTWVGGDSTGRLEKVIDMTQYVGRAFDETRYHPDARRMPHVLDVKRKGAAA